MATPCVEDLLGDHLAGFTCIFEVFIVGETELGVLAHPVDLASAPLCAGKGVGREAGS